MTYKLYVARPSQLEALLKLCMQGLKEGHEKHLPLNKYKVKTLLNECITNDHQLAIVAMEKGAIKGMAIGYVSSHAYADGLVAEDLAIYVKRSMRGTDCYQSLVKAYDSWCDRIPNLLGSTLSLSRLNATTQVMDKLYTGIGYKRVGVDYLKLRGEYECNI